MLGILAKDFRFASNWRKGHRKEKQVFSLYSVTAWLDEQRQGQERVWEEMRGKPSGL